MKIFRMNTAALVSRPPSPPHSTDGDTGLSEGKQHAIKREPYTPPRSIRPALGADTNLVSSSVEYRAVAATAEKGLPAQGLYGDPSTYQIAPSHSPYPVQPLRYPDGASGRAWLPTDSPQTFVRTRQYHTPPTAIAESGTQTRNRRALRSPLSPGNPQFSRHLRSSPRPKKTERHAKAGKSKGPLIEQPLSVLTADYNIPVKDMHAWVHRPVADRMREVEKKKGYISRPMNSFMLYRSAYADRVKQFCKENNHQVVSQVTGASWPLEPKEVREMYEQYAVTERDNHHVAHPGYKFAPNKNAKKRARVDDDASDDDPDWEGSSRSAKRSRKSRPGDSRSQSSTPFAADRIPRHQMLEYDEPALHPSSYQAINPHGPAPITVGPEGFIGQYYQTTVTPYGQHVDDVKFGRLGDPFQQYETNGPIVGLPNGFHHDLLASHPSVMLLQMQGEMLDPRLSQYDPKLQYPQYETVDPQYTIPQQYDCGSYAAQQGIAYPQGNSYHPGMATLTDGQSTWTEPDQVGSAFDEEFQRWT
jgi:HMG (high mobility group) box